ncbi:serine--tRNA ligase [Helicobacter sp. MIT 00-7814]|uniref:serine--tRNA ligase n=1 Tax=unclassified Helicobacter TaxID=2593540 RepID=UPI000E1EE065|nr:MULTISPECIES: serine--tRNA ligase [unclassified Helicobacter]RDU55229.1 serine--tRNA ligase [Helicobacter sp. MIT 99-10781]RDU56067.1 serine--tRNA ligase [Helicobacter sp. MIT 00-7814]
MIDTKLLLNDFEFVAQKLQIKKVSKELLQELYTIACEYKAQKQKLEELQAFKNSASKEFATLRAQNKDTNELKAKLDSNKQEMQEAQKKLEKIESALTKISYTIPNLPDSKTPEGEDEHDNVEIKKILEPRAFDFEPKEHWELANKNGWIDFEAGVRLAKSRFSVLRGMGARLNRALINFMLDYNQKAGFEAVVTPVIVNKNCLFGTGQLPKFESDMFKIGNQDFEELDSTNLQAHELYLISTSEITLTNLYNDTIIPKSELPIMLTAQTPCFRKEAGSAGKDTRGMIRQHQFDKVELVAITTPEQSDCMQEKMLQTASGILQELGLPHRFMQLCGGDLGFSASNTIDIEVWLPGQKCYREISSISNTRDFQARRAKIRYKDEKKNLLAHTLNGSSLAVGRTLIAIMENYQNKDGSIEIPQVLQKYL